MRGKTAVWLRSSLLLSIVFCAHAVFGQGHIGGDIGLGLSSTPANTGTTGTLAIPMGVFYDRTIHKATVGLDLRTLGGGSDEFEGWGVGPRLTFPIGRSKLFIPYAEFLLGSGGMDEMHVSYPAGTANSTHVGGVVVGTSIGIDLMSGPHAGLRFNYDYGQARGNVNTTYSSVSMGFVFHFKTK
jgi:hypothetical protein